VADIELKRMHSLGLAGARAAAERMAAQLASRFDLKGDWRGNVMHFERPGLTGSLAVGEHEVHLSVALGFLLKAMKGSIQSAVEREMETLFAAAPPARPAPSAPPKKAR
jgi:putative polyhydroxyalkanoate system protein